MTPAEEGIAKVVEYAERPAERLQKKHIYILRNMIATVIRAVEKYIQPTYQWNLCCGSLVMVFSPLFLLTSLKF
jgi:hypothetical protein